MNNNQEITLDVKLSKREKRKIIQQENLNTAKRLSFVTENAAKYRMLCRFPWLLCFFNLKNTDTEIIQLGDVSRQLNQAVKLQDYEKAKNLRNTEDRIKQRVLSEKDSSGIVLEHFILSKGKVELTIAFLRRSK